VKLGIICTMIFSILIFSVVLTPQSFGYGGDGGGWNVLDPRVCGDKLCSEIPGGRDAWENKETIPLTIKNVGVNFAFAESYPDLGVKVETVAENLSIPWSIDFAYDGRIFFSERTGTLQVIENGVQKQIMALDVGAGEGGMLGDIPLTKTLVFLTSQKNLLAPTFLPDFCFL